MKILSKLKPLLISTLIGVVLFGVLYLFGSGLASSDLFKDKDTQKSVSDEKQMLEMINSGEISEEDLDSMYFSREELKTILKKVDDSKKLITNLITYEYYFEEWTVIGYEEDDNGNLTDEEIWGWNTGYRKKTKTITNEEIENPNVVEWQPIYALAAMASIYEEDRWEDAVSDGEWYVQERIDDEVLDNAIRVFNYEYNYLFDGARTSKTSYSWDELESICYRYEETGDWDAESYPPGEYHIRTCEKIPESCVSNICNALTQYDYQFCKNTHCTPRYQYPDNWEVDYRIYDVDPDILTRCCQLVAPNFEWEYFLTILETLPGVEDTVSETGEIKKKGILSKYKEYYDYYLTKYTKNEEQHDISDEGIIVGEELTDFLFQTKTYKEWDGEEFSSPLSSYTRVSSEFGYRWHPILGTWKNHTGIDIAASTGTDIYTVLDGVVTVASNNSVSGNYVVIDHGNGLKTVYAHASSIDVEVGQVVTKGQVIAAVGSTGRSTGPHLHFGVSLDNQYVDPYPYLENCL